jgi:hypothetical protein
MMRSSFTIGCESAYYCEAMNKRKTHARRISTRKPKSETKANHSRIHGVRGKYRGEGLMKALMMEKKREREL